MSSAILHQKDYVPDWKALRTEMPEVASRQLQNILVRLDGNEKTVYAMRGMAALLVEERKLYRFVVDEEVGDYYLSFDKWLKDVCPNSWSYVREALRSVKELRDVPFEDLLQMPRSNIMQLKATSSNVRTDPEVIEAAKTMPEKKLVEKLNTERGQHLEMKRPVAMPVGDASEFERAIKVAMVIEEAKTREEAIKAIAIAYLQDNEQRYDELKETA